jgi:hypothetical protein
MRVNHVAKCRKSPGDCGKCGKTIEVGQPYRWVQAKYSSKRFRCEDSACSFRQSELVSSDKLSRVYGAQEQLEDFVNGWDGSDLQELKDACEECASELKDVAQEYSESADNIRNTISESPTADECEEKSQNIEGWADEIESAGESLEEFEGEDEDESEDDEDAKPEDETKRIAWADACKEAVNDALGNCPL